MLHRRVLPGLERARRSGEAKRLKRAVGRGRDPRDRCEERWAALTIVELAQKDVDCPEEQPIRGSVIRATNLDQAKRPLRVRSFC